MKMPESFFSRVVLACMPFLAYAFGPEKTWRVAALVTGVYWLSLFAFWFTRRFFPGRTATPVFFLWLGLWGQLAWTILGLLPFWIVSVFLLMPSGFLDERRTADRTAVFLPRSHPGPGRRPRRREKAPEYFAERILNGLGFFVFIECLEAANGLAGRIGHTDPVRGPAVIFFLLFLTAFLWKNQPARTSGRGLPDSAGQPAPKARTLKE